MENFLRSVFTSAQKIVEKRKMSVKVENRLKSWKERVLDLKIKEKQTVHPNEYKQKGVFKQMIGYITGHQYKTITTEPQVSK